MVWGKEHEPPLSTAHSERLVRANALRIAVGCYLRSPTTGNLERLKAAYEAATFVKHN